jgi:hypothetical protein
VGGMAVLAEVCKHGDTEVRKLVHDRIKEAGAAAGRELSCKLCLYCGRWDLVRRLGSPARRKSFA